jgi:thiamine pyrophosphokinase
VKKILVLANGDMPPREILADLVRNRDLIICCDGAYIKAARAGIRPDLVIGDMDSLHIPYNRTVKTMMMPNQDNTDLEKALNYLIESDLGSGSQIVVAGASGGRTDFTLYNLHLLMRYRRLDLFLVDALFTVFLIQRRCEIKGIEKGTLVSLLPLAPCRRVKSEGLEFQFKNAELIPGEYESISNRSVSGPVRISLASGNLACFIAHEPKNFRVLHHVSRSPMPGTGQKPDKESKNVR